MAKKRKDGRYQRKVTLSDGRQKIVYGKTLAELNAAADALRDEDRQGIKIGDNTLVGEWAKIWLENYKSSLRASTIRMYRTAYNCHIMDFIGGIPLRNVKNVHIQNIMKNCAELSESAQQKVKLTLTQLFESAVDNHLITFSPCKKIKITKHKRPEKTKYLTFKQSEILMNSLKGERERALCGLCLYAGLRREEALGLQWSDIKDNCITINRTITFIHNRPDSCQDLKTKAAHRTIPLTERLKNILDNTPKRSIYIITNANGGEITEQGFKRLWKKVQDTVDFHVTPHMLRHTYATSLCLADVKLKRAQYLLGHSNIQMTADIYTHVTAKDVKNDVIALNEYYNKSSQKVVKKKNA